VWSSRATSASSFKYLDEEGEVRDVTFRVLNAYAKKVVGSAFTSKYFRAFVGP
jgi:DNA topoisomerase IB